MKLKFSNPGELSKAIDLISELVTEVKINVSEAGLGITAMDPANVAMVNFKIPKSSFSEFEISEGESSEPLGVNLDNLKRILKRCSSKSQLIIEKDENSLLIKIQDKIQRNFTLALLDVDVEDKSPPNLEYTANIEIFSQDLIDSIEDCAVVSDACSFIVEDNKFIIEAKELNTTRSEFSGDEVTIQAENCKSRYSLEYLQKFMKGAKLCEKTILKFANEHPLRIEFKTPNLEIFFILAPRVETE
ncbi:MAG: DNA polymerase sliding clamp [Nanoarchaeota archaeon]